MSKRLSAEDCDAVDLLLERPEATGGDSLVEAVFARPVREQFEARLNAAEKVLSLLDHMPPAEPSNDLMSRTLQRIEQARLEPSASESPEQDATREISREL